MVHPSAKYNSEDNLLEDIKPLVVELMKLRNLLKIAYAIRRIRWIHRIRQIRWIRRVYQIRRVRRIR